jgi:hypothetical protein
MSLLFVDLEFGTKRVTPGLFGSLELKPGRASRHRRGESYAARTSEPHRFPVGCIKRTKPGTANFKAASNTTASERVNPTRRRKTFAPRGTGGKAAGTSPGNPSATSSGCGALTQEATSPSGAEVTMYTRSEDGHPSVLSSLRSVISTTTSLASRRLLIDFKTS